MVRRLKRKFLYSRFFRRIVGWSRRLILPGFEGFSLYEISRFFFNALFNGRLIDRASAIAFKTFMAFFPAVIVLLTLIPYVPVPDFQERLLATFQEMLPHEVYTFIESTLHDLVVKKHGTLLSVSFIVGIYLASNSIDAILDGFSGSTNLVRWHTALKQRLLSLALLVMISLLTVLAIPVLAFSDLVIGELHHIRFFANELELWAALGVKWLVSILLVMVAVSLLYTAGDPTARRFRTFTPGSILAVFLILLISQGLAFVFNNITDYNALYGSIGAILAVQLWIYFNMIALLIGYELNASISWAKHHHTRHLHVPEAASPANG